MNAAAPRSEPIYRAISGLILAVRNCQDATRPGGRNPEWEKKHSIRIAQIVKSFMPSGSGIDNGTLFDFDRSEPEKLMFLCGFHHMNGDGYYDGWTEHTIAVRPSLWCDFRLTISGPDRNDIKENLHEIFDHALRQRVYQEGAEPFNYRLMPEA